MPLAVVTSGEVPKTRRQKELITSSGTHMVFYEADIEHVYLQSIPIVLAYNKVNHYTATKIISQEQFQNWKVEQCYLLGKSFIKSSSIVNKEFVSQEISSKLEGCVDSIKELLNLFAMQWTEGASGEDQPLGPILHVPNPPGQPHYLSSVSAKRKHTSDKSTMTCQILPSPPLPPSSLPTPQSSLSHPFQQNPPTKKAKNLWTVQFVKNTSKEVMT